VTSNSADPTSGIASAQFQVALHNGSFANLGAADTTSPYGVTWDTTAIANAQYDLRLVTTDNAGNTFTSPIVTVTVANPLTILTVVRDGGNKKVHFTGSGAAATTTITITICTVNSFPCAGGNTAGTATVTAPTGGAWTSAPDTNNLNGSQTYFAQAVQGAATSAVFTFSTTGL
jgi:hypothetical protein